MRLKTALMAALALTLVMGACVASGDGVRKDGETFLMKGTVRVVGNEPFTRLVLTVPAPEGRGRPTDHVVRGPLAGELRDRHQGKVVIVECRSCMENARGHLPPHVPCIEPEKIVEVE